MSSDGDRFDTTHFTTSIDVSVTMTGHIQTSKAMLHRWQHLTGFVCPKAIVTVAMAKRAIGNRGSDYAKHGEVE